MPCTGIHGIPSNPLVHSQTDSFNSTTKYADKTSKNVNKTSKSQLRVLH